MPRPVVVERPSASTAVSPVGVSKASPAEIDNVNSGTVYRTTTNNPTGLFWGWSLEELRQAQEADPDIGPIRAWMETSNERPPWKGAKTKGKVVHHDHLKPYRCRDPLDSTWVVEHARRWTPTEVSPTLDIDPVDPTLGLSQLFTDSDSAAEEDSSCPSLDPEVDTAAVALNG
ncbi:hypothetical protein NHX12_005491 [Muraenolepis orangiensis]|uniref:Uncharacterized protein n=1 Tax=Muraenolepis orangiensis TaxID=630683 RepID=A0A9Q0ICC5_9TELE|nr:hypothetical protein NHX12_005491 [Muraenolepis orangiensis]